MKTFDEIFIEFNAAKRVFDNSPIAIEYNATMNSVKLIVAKVFGCDKDEIAYCVFIGSNKFECEIRWNNGASPDYLTVNMMLDDELITIEAIDKIKDRIRFLLVNNVSMKKVKRDTIAKVSACKLIEVPIPEEYESFVDEAKKKLIKNNKEIKKLENKLDTIVSTF